jgi:hypothetical protein
MKNFALRHPFVASLLVFLTIFVGGTVAIMICGILMIGECKPISPGDPCDGGALLLAALWMLVVPASLILGIIAGISTFVILIRKIETKEEQSYK